MNTTTQDPPLQTILDKCQRVRLDRAQRLQHQAELLAMA
jgi:hypothetical protein